jgi:hypothetical protein
VPFDIFGTRDSGETSPGINCEETFLFTTTPSWTSQKPMSVHLYTAPNCRWTWGHELLLFSCYGKDGGQSRKERLRRRSTIGTVR